MKQIALLLFFIAAFSVNAQEKKQFLKDQIVEVSCGQCNFGMKDKKGCDLAVRIEGKTYFVDGTQLDDHGDAHAKDGFCATVRKAKVTGVVENGRFNASAFQLLPAEEKKK